MSPKPKLRNPIFNVAKPFDFLVWILLLTTMLSVFNIVALTKWLGMDALRLDILCMLGLLIHQGLSHLVVHKSKTEKVFFVSGFLFLSHWPAISFPDFGVFLALLLIHSKRLL